MQSEILPNRLSASYEGSFAYKTVKDRMPAILVSVIDTLHREKDAITKKIGKEGTAELKEVVGRLSKLRYELMTNKPLEQLTDGLPDAAAWNKYLSDEMHANGEPKWFKSSWLYVECYMYRKIMEAIHLSPLLRHFDPFGNMKREAFINSKDAVKVIMNRMLSTVRAPPTAEEEIKEVVRIFFELSLWGNKCDLSISGGQENSQKTDPIKQLASLKEFLLVDDFDLLWSYLLSVKRQIASTPANDPKQGHKQCGQIDFVLDNAGFEFIADICLAEILIVLGFAQRIVFHLKSSPWFVSDVTMNDVIYTVSELKASSLLVSQLHVNSWLTRGLEGSFILDENPYWTLPYDFASMKAEAPDLYSKLSCSNLIIMKGDLNYRKLVGDRMWPTVTDFDTALRSFQPAPLLALRTLKSENCVGLREGMEQDLSLRSPTWMVSGDFGLLQLAKKSVERQLQQTSLPKI